MLNWTSKLEARAKKERAGLVVVPRVARDPEVTLAEIRALIGSTARVKDWFEAGLSSSNEPQLTKAFLDTYVGDEAPTDDPRVAGLALAILPWANSWGHFEARMAPTLIDHWIDRYGLPFALDAARPFGFFLMAEPDALSVRRVRAESSFTERRQAAWVRRMIAPTIATVLAAAVAALDAGGREALEPTVATLWARGGLEDRALLASVLGDARRVEAFLRQRNEGTVPVEACVYLAERALVQAEDAKLLAAYFTGLDDGELDALFGVMGGRPFLAALAQRHRDAVIPSLVGLLTSVDRARSTPDTPNATFNEYSEELIQAAREVLAILAHATDEGRVIQPVVRLLETTQRLSRTRSLAPALTEVLLQSPRQAWAAVQALGERPWLETLRVRLSQLAAEPKKEGAKDVSALSLEALPAPAKKPRAGSEALLALPPLLDKEGRVLTEPVAARVVALLKEGTTDAMVAVSDHCDRAAVAAHLLARIEEWDEGRSKDVWALGAIGRFADAELSEKLAAKVVGWTKGAAWKRAVLGLGALAQIADKRSLHTIAALREARTYKPVKEAARAAFAAAAKTLELSEDQLAARVAPTVTVDDSGCVRFDLGGREVVVDFDERLLPVASLGGKPVAAIPKAAPGDDRARVAAANAAWKELKRGAKAAASAQLGGLERAMCNAAQWSREDFVELYLVDAYVRHATRRLLWRRVRGEERALFAVERDGTLRDAAGAPIALEAGDVIELPHPVRIEAAERGAWSALYEAPERKQPFEQLARIVYREEELPELADAIVELPARLIQGLAASGWRRGEMFDAGVYHELTRQIGGFVVELAFEEGVPVVGAEGEVDVEATVARRVVRSARDDIDASELGRELARLAARGGG